MANEKNHMVLKPNGAVIGVTSVQWGILKNDPKKRYKLIGVKSEGESFESVQGVEEPQKKSADADAQNAEEDDGFQIHEPTIEELRDRYEALTGEPVNKRWGIKRLKNEINNYAS